MNAREKLIEQYQQKHAAEPGYGAGNRMHREVIEWMERHKFQSVLDWGCGKGELVTALRGQGYRAEGYDPAVPGWDVAPTEPCEAVVSLDVLEHLHPDHLTEDLWDLFGYASKGVYLNISTVTAYHKLPDGRNCHEIVQPAEWWRKRILDDVREWEIDWEHAGACNYNLSLRRK